MTEPLVVLRYGVGELVIRADCTCGLCRAYREEPTIFIRTLEENARRGGKRFAVLSDTENA